MQLVQIESPAEPALLTVAEVAAALRLDASTVYRAAASGEIRAVRLSAKIGSAIRIPAAELERLVEPQEGAVGHAVGGADRERPPAVSTPGPRAGRSDSRHPGGGISGAATHRTAKRPPLNRAHTL